MTATADITSSASTSSSETPLFEARNVSKSFGHIRALIDVDFEIRPNEVVGLLGDNGAGKSTLIRCFSGILQPDTGQFYRNGEPVTFRSRRDSDLCGIETIYQDTALISSMSIMRNIFAGRELVNGIGLMRVKAMRDTAMDILEKHVRIAGVTSPDLLISELSGGQAQAVAIARAIHFEHSILLLDEPTSALSVRETEKVLQTIVNLSVDGKASVMVTHNVYHAFQVCDRFVVMAHGRVIRTARKEDTSIQEITKLLVKH